MDEGVDGGAVPAVFEALGGFYGIEDGFQNKTFAQHEFIEQRHQVIAPVFADASDRLQAVLPQIPEQGLREIALVRVEFAVELCGHARHRLAVIGVAGGDLHRHDFRLVIDDDVQLEAIEPSH